MITLPLTRILCRHLFSCDCDPCQKKRAAPWVRAEGGGGGGWAGRVQGVLLQAECDGAGEEGQPEGHPGHQGWVTLAPAAVLPWTVSEPLRRRGSRRTRQPSTKRSFRRSRLAAISIHYIHYIHYLLHKTLHCVYSSLRDTFPASLLHGDKLSKVLEAKQLLTTTGAGAGLSSEELRTRTVSGAARLRPPSCPPPPSCTGSTCL